MSERSSDDLPDEPVDHLDSSPSETVRRHAATFRSVRLRLAARESRAELEGESVEGESVGAVGGGADGEDPGHRVEPWVVGGDGLRVLGARAAASAVEGAASAGWTAGALAARGRRGGDGPWVDSAVVRAWRRDEFGVAWVAAHWRADPVRVPYRRTWKFVSAIVRVPRNGTRTVGARELTAKISSPNNDALECEQTGIGEGGEGSHGEGRG